MTAAAASLPTASWTLASTRWRDEETVELSFVDWHSRESALVTVEIRAELPSTASEPAYPEELVVVDVEGAALPAEAEVERWRDELVAEFWAGHPLKGRR